MSLPAVPASKGGRIGDGEAPVKMIPGEAYPDPNRTRQKATRATQRHCGTPALGCVFTPPVRIATTSDCRNTWRFLLVDWIYR